MSRRRQPQVLRSIFYHNCDIRVEEPVPKVSPYAPTLVRWWASLEEFRTIRRTRSTEQFLRSSKAFRNEKDRHVNNPEYYFTIHPFSTIALIESILMTFVWGTYLTIGPLRNFFYHLNFASHWERAKHPVHWMMKVARPILFMDIIFQFFLGYVIEKTQEIVLDRKRIVFHYLKRYMIIDTFILFIGHLEWALPQDDHLGQILFDQFNYLMVIRFQDFLKNLDFFLKSLKVSKNFRVCFGLILTGLFLMHWWACILRLVTVVYLQFDFHKEFEQTWFAAFKLLSSSEDFKEESRKSLIELLGQSNIYPNYVVQVASHFFGAMLMTYPTNDPFEQLVFSLIIFTGMAFYVYATAIILEIFGIVNISEEKYESLIYQATEYMTIKKYPRNIKKRVLSYYNYKFNKKFFSEMKILDGLSEHLRMEVILYSCRNLIEQMAVFRGLSKATIGSILALLKPEVYLKKDIVMTVGDEEKTVFFILYGTCVVELMSGVELLHQEDGDVFGIAHSSIIGRMTTPFIYKITTIEPCEIFTLSDEDARYCCGRHSDFRDRLRALTKRREKLFSSVYSRVVQSTTSIDSGEIVSELRKKRILHRGRERILYF